MLDLIKRLLGMNRSDSVRQPGSDGATEASNTGPRSLAGKVIMPEPQALIRRTKALAALDLILSPAWEVRYYSFNSRWAAGEQMASMRNGCGDEWWIVFHDSGWAALKGLGHDSPAWQAGRSRLSAELRSAIPAALSGFANEPAFRWDQTSFAGYRAPSDDDWFWPKDGTAFANMSGGEDEFLSLLAGGPEDYMDYAADYFEVDLPLAIVEAIFDLAPITPEMVRLLNPEVSWEEIEEQLHGEIGYPPAT
jgi:hypothetical protein